MFAPDHVLADVGEFAGAKKARDESHEPLNEPRLPLWDRQLQGQIGRATLQNLEQIVLAQSEDCFHTMTAVTSPQSYCAGPTPSCCPEPEPTPHVIATLDLTSR